MKYRGDLKLSEIEGAWKGECSTSLIKRCREFWDTPISELSDQMVATYLKQRIGKAFMIDEAKRRLANEKRDDSELYDGELKEAYERIRDI
ncbi:MAG: hypothetical protein AAF431_12345 [Pseudomonadota bacterium]